LQPEDIRIYQKDPKLSPKASFLRLDGPAVITSLQWVNDGLEVRLYNPLCETTQNKLHTANWPKSVQVPKWMQAVDFESNPQGNKNPMDQGIYLKPKQILTLRLS
jgi:hypothetical protein